MKIGNILMSARLYCDKTQSEFSKDLGISQSYLSKLERNESSPTLETLDKYAKYFNVPTALFVMLTSQKEGTLKDKFQKFLFKKIVFDFDKETGDLMIMNEENEE